MLLAAGQSAASSCLMDGGHVVGDRLRERRFYCSDVPGPSFTITCGMASPSSVLLVGDVFEPVDGLAIELLLHGDVGHRRGWRRPVPVLFARGKPHDVTGANLFHGSAPALGAAEPGCHDQRLAERM